MRKVTETKISVLDERIHRTFKTGVILKGLNGLFEIGGGLALLVFDPSRLNGFVSSLTQQELAEDPNDFIARHLMDFFHHLSPSVRLFGILYLLSHGIVKVGLVAGLLRDKLWAYPASLIVLFLFISYQIYQLSFHITFGMMALTLFDLVIVFLIWFEYKNRRKILGTHIKIQ